MSVQNFQNLSASRLLVRRDLRLALRLWPGDFGASLSRSKWRRWCRNSNRESLISNGVEVVLPASARVIFTAKVAPWKTTSRAWWTICWRRTLRFLPRRFTTGKCPAVCPRFLAFQLRRTWKNGRFWFTAWTATNNLCRRWALRILASTMPFFYFSRERCRNFSNA